MKDTALTLQAMNPDVIVIRHSSSGAAQFLAERLHCGVVNAGDGWHAHPTQALLDAFPCVRSGDTTGTPSKAKTCLSSVTAPTAASAAPTCCCSPNSA